MSNSYFNFPLRQITGRTWLWYSLRCLIMLLDLSLMYFNSLTFSGINLNEKMIQSMFRKMSHYGLIISCLWFMMKTINQKITHLGKGLSKCAHFVKCAHFIQNAHILPKCNKILDFQWEVTFSFWWEQSEVYHFVSENG